ACSGFIFQRSRWPREDSNHMIVLSRPGFKFRGVLFETKHRSATAPRDMVRSSTGMKPTAYIETTVISYLTAWTSRDLLRAAQQRSTREWWETQRDRFDVITSELVVLEASSGDPTAAADPSRRLLHFLC